MGGILPWEVISDIMLRRYGNRTVSVFFLISKSLISHDSDKTEKTPTTRASKLNWLASSLILHNNETRYF